LTAEDFAALEAEAEAQDRAAAKGARYTTADFPESELCGKPRPT
jgi:hypothetical protein